MTRSVTTSARCSVTNTTAPVPVPPIDGGGRQMMGQLAVPPGMVDELVEEALVWCSQHGLVVGDRNHPAGSAFETTYREWKVEQDWNESRSFDTAYLGSVTPQSTVTKEDQANIKTGTSKDDASDHSAKRSSDVNAAPTSPRTRKETNRSEIPSVSDLNVPGTTTTPATSSPVDVEEATLVFEKMPEPTYDYPIGSDEDATPTLIHRVVKEGISEETIPTRTLYHTGKFAIAGFDESDEQEELKTFEGFTEKAYHSFQRLKSHMANKSKLLQLVERTCAKAMETED
ncbi:hypothetical protein PR202_ga03600 [Eleusine coracana subsp. coracana]|uniref:Uncharacterized protein n=1 Tax=Eleusine coracana subsp. coracana TaxID=191504 RepID=A0AAV5BNT0_ELECO|nr:hypothetical protein PR202_ga03600 [Eleusine coracana subsp. coracana]